MHNQGLCQFFMVSLYLSSSGSSALSQRPLKSAAAQKALQGSEMEMRELLVGTEEISVSPPRGVIDLPSVRDVQIKDFYRQDT